MIRVCEDEEDILEDVEVVLLEKGVRCLRVLAGHIIDELHQHGKTSAFDFTVVMLAGPEARIDDKLELPLIELEQSREAAVIDGFEKLEKLYSVLRVFGEVLVDHV